MPSKKKKTKGKGRGAAKSSKKELSKGKGVETEGGDDVKNVTSQMKRLKVNSDQNKDEDALLDAAINLAAAERDELEAAEAKNCNHGFVLLPDMNGFLSPQEQEERGCEDFIDSFTSEFMATASKKSCFGDRFLIAVENTKFHYFGVWNDPNVMQTKISYLLAKGVDAILEKKVSDARQPAMLASFMEQYRAAFVSKAPTRESNLLSILNGGTSIRKDDPAWNWGKIHELSNDTCDEHTIVSFFRKRIPCKCLARRYKEVKSIVKMGRCSNPSCPLPNGEVECSKLLYCSKCFTACFCSRECQVAAWSSHKEHCESLDEIPVAFKCRVAVRPNGPMPGHEDLY